MTDTEVFNYLYENLTEYNKEFKRLINDKRQMIVSMKEKELLNSYDDILIRISSVQRIINKKRRELK